MADGSNVPAVGGAGAEKKRKPGRPKGSTNKAKSITDKARADLYEYARKRYNGTYGQQLVDLVMITPMELRQGKQWAITRGLNPKLFSRTELAWRLKAFKVEELYGLKAGEALAYLHKAGADLLALMHRKQAALEPEAAAAYAMMEGVQVDMAILDNIQQNQQFDLSFDDVVTQDASHTDENP